MYAAGTDEQAASRRARSLKHLPGDRRRDDDSDISCLDPPRSFDHEDTAAGEGLAMPRPAGPSPRTHTCRYRQRSTSATCETTPPAFLAVRWAVGRAACTWSAEVGVRAAEPAVQLTVGSSVTRCRAGEASACHAHAHTPALLVLAGRPPAHTAPAVSSWPSSIMA